MGVVPWVWLWVWYHGWDYGCGYGCGTMGGIMGAVMGVVPWLHLLCLQYAALKNHLKDSGRVSGMKELMLHHLITNTQMAWDLFPQFQSDKTYYGNHTFQISSPSLPRHLCLKAPQMVMTRGLYLHTDYLLPPSPPPPLILIH